MFFLGRLKIYIFFVLLVGLFPCFLFGQCPTPASTGFIKSPVAGFGTIGGGDKFEANTVVDIKANTTLSAATKLSIRYRVGYLSTPTFKVSDFNCSGPCKSNPNVIIPTLTSFEIIQTPDLSITFNVPGVYTILQSYTDAVSGIGYYECFKIVIYPIPKSSYRTCGCDIVLITILPIPENLFYDNMEVFFTATNQKIIIPKSDYGKEFASQPIPGGCSDRSSFKVTGQANLPPIVTQSEPLTTPILFSTSSNTYNFIKEMSREADDSFVLKFNSAVDELQVSYDGSTTWSNLPVTSYLVLSAGKEFKVSGVIPPLNGDLCIRGNSRCGSSVSSAIACYTGEIKEIKDEFGAASGRRDVIVTLKTKLNFFNASVLVSRDTGTPNQYSISSGTNDYRDDKANCGDLVYRTKTTISNIGGGITTIYSKPVSYKLTGGNLKPIEGSSTVSIKSTSFTANGQSADLNFSPNTSSGKSFNFYKSSNGGPFVKVNSSPINQTFLQDLSTDPTVINCYYVKYQDQCGFESPPSKTICTTLLKSNGNLIEWSNDNVAVNMANNYENISGYTPQLVECVNGSCSSTQSFTTISLGNSFNMDIADVNPLTVHKVNIRVQVQFNGSTRFSVFSNIIEFFFQPKLFVPSIITPNADNFNDDLVINGFHIKSIVFDIYNRWGEKIETLTNLNQRWRPDVNLPEGEYFYKAVATDYSPIPKEITKEGSILLVR
jgi:gliding motility-associated-like protein